MEVHETKSALLLVVEAVAVPHVKRFLSGIKILWDVRKIVEDDYWSFGMRSDYNLADALYTAKWWEMFERWDEEKRPYGRLPGSPLLSDQIAAYEKTLKGQDLMFAPRIEIVPVFQYNGEVIR